MPIIFGRSIGGGGGGGGGGSLSLPIIGGDRLSADTTPTAYEFLGESTWSRATVNTTGGNLILGGGLGRRLFTIVSNAALDTKTVLLTANGTLVTLTATTGAPGANQFGPIGPDDTAPGLAMTALALATAINAQATLGPLMTGSSTAAVCYIDKAPTLYSLVIASGTAGALITATSGADGAISAAQQIQTVGTMTAVSTASLGEGWSRYDWTNAMIVALGGVGAGDIAVCTLKAKTVVVSAYVVINTAETSANALTGAVGRVAAGYIDYIVASDMKAAANTVYGDAAGERGTNLTGYDLPSYTGTTVVNMHFIKTTSFLNTCTASTGSVFLKTMILP